MKDIHPPKWFIFLVLGITIGLFISNIPTSQPAAAHSNVDDKLELEREIQKLSEEKQRCVELLEESRNQCKEEPVTEKAEQPEIRRVLRGDLEGKEELFLTSFSDPEIGKYVMSVICAESGCGQHSCGKYNYSGIMKNGRCEYFESVEDYIENGVKKRTGIYFNRLHERGVSEQSLNDIFIGKGRYCTSSCEHWTKNFLATYNEIK
jgi:hypothetical protein